MSRRPKASPDWPGAAWQVGPKRAHAAQRIELALLFPNAIAKGIWPILEAGISSAEEDRAARFVFAEDRQCFVAAHWLKRRMLSRADPATKPLAWRFDDGLHGKPRIAGGSDLHFNLSHCHGLVACAIRRGGPIGVDVEFLGGVVEESVVAHYFSRAEAAWWRSQAEAEKVIAFFSIWTLKEAFIKATGDGMSRPLQSFSVDVSRACVVTDEDQAGQSTSWRLYQTKLGGQHLLAAAWRDVGNSEEMPTPMIVQPEDWL